MENEIRRLEDKIASLENEFHSRINRLEKGEVHTDTLYCKKIVISPEDEYDSPLIINFPNGSKCMSLTFSEETGNGHLTFYNGDNSVTEIGVCEHGGGRIVLNNIDGEPMVYIGGQADSDDHQPMIDIANRYMDKGWKVRLDSEDVGFYDEEDPY